jgi:hypothetical protein
MAGSIKVKMKGYVLSAVALAILNNFLPAPTLDPTVDFVAGTVAGMAGLAVGFPFDTGAFCA